MAKQQNISLHGAPKKKDVAKESQSSESLPCQRPSENLHQDTVGLEKVTHGVYTNSKQLNKLKSKIDQKRKQTKSKHLESCKTEYDSTYSDLIYEIKKLQQLMPTNGDEEYYWGLNNKCDACDQKQRTIWRLEEYAETLNKKNHQTLIDLRNAENKVSQMQNQLRVLTEQLREETSSKEDAIRRLSELASSKLRDNNPNITDLSDENRPTKLAEQVSELYDNEWTDAFDELETSRYSDLEIVEYLVTAFMNIYEECRRITTDGFEKIQACIQHSDVIPQKSGNLKLPDQLRQQAKDFRKLSAAKNIENIIEGILNLSSFEYLNKQPYNGAKAKPYIRKCIKLSWLMCVQDPPLVMSTETERQFRSTLFREYTTRGPYVAYVVWPVMYLHEGGPVLSKGVAQGSNQDSKDEFTA